MFPTTKKNTCLQSVRIRVRFSRECEPIAANQQQIRKHKKQIGHERHNANGCRSSVSPLCKFVERERSAVSRDQEQTCSNERNTCGFPGVNVPRQCLTIESCRSNQSENHDQ